MIRLTAASQSPAIRRGFLLIGITAACSIDQPTTAPIGGAVTASAIAASSYIVVLEPNAAPAAVAASVGASPKFVYTAALNGFAAELPPEAVTALERNPNVSYIDPDGVARTTDTQFAPLPWGLDRTDQHDLPLGGSYTYPNLGAGVHAYIIDSGIRSTHSEFTGRIEPGVNFTYEAGTEDCLGHGTHVSGTVGGTTYGVAKAVTVVPVRVFNCIGSAEWSVIIAAMDWVVANAVKPAVINMSLGGDYVQAVDDAVRATVASGITVVVAAGNAYGNACLDSPASTPEAITVAASRISDAKASFSNWGPCVDLFAPGVDVQSAWYDGDNATAWLSGTSMASPHVAGAAALLLSANPALTPADVQASINASATVGKIWLTTGDRMDNTFNRLLFIGAGVQDPPPPPEPPPPSTLFSKVCSGYVCTFSAVNDGAWDFGDGSTGSGVTVSHQFAPKKSYTVTHTVAGNPVPGTASVNCRPKGRCQ